MSDREKMEKLLKKSTNGIITAAQVTEAGMHRSVLQALVESGEIYRFGKGLYMRTMHGKMIFICFSESMDVEFILMGRHFTC